MSQGTSKIVYGVIDLSADEVSVELITRESFKNQETV